MADGKLNKAQITAAKEGVEGELIGEQVKESKAEVKESKEIGAEAKKYIDNKEIYDNKSLVNILNSQVLLEFKQVVRFKLLLK